MSAPENNGTPEREIGAIEFNVDGELVYWNGHEWKPYRQLPSGEPTRFRDAQADEDDR